MKETTIFKQLLVRLIVPVVIALLLLAFFNNIYTSKILVKTNTEKNYIIYDEIKNLIEFQDFTLSILELNLEARMKDLSTELSSKYLTTGRWMSNLNLDSLRKVLSMKQDMEDIYIINRDGIIINTTYLNDLNLNFFNFGDFHRKYFNDILKGNKFVSERFAIESTTKRLRKYSYQPILNKQFVLEIGIYSDKADQIIELINKRLDDIAKRHTGIKSIEMFIGEDKPFSFNKDVKIKEGHEEILKRIFQTKRNDKIEENEGGRDLRYEYIYMQRKNTDLYKSSVILIVSDLNSERYFLSSELYRSFFLFLLTILIIVFLLYRNVQVLTSPIEKLAEKMDRITETNTGERAEIIGNNEIARLSRRFNLMLEKVERRTTEIIQQQEEIQAQREQLLLVNQELDKLSIVASKTDNGVAIYDKDGHLEWINVGYERIYGFSFNEIIYNIGTHITDIIQNPDIEIYLNICLKTKQSVSFETYIKTKSEQFFWIQTTLTPILDDLNSVQKLIAIDSNISTTKRVEERVRQINKDIRDSIIYAKKIQETILPEQSRLNSLFAEYFILFKPRDIVSGDFYWFTKKGNKVLIAAADCTGHGVPGALIGMLGVTYLNEIINKSKSLRPNEILNKLRIQLIRSFQKEGKTDETKDGMDIALCVIDEDNWKMEYAGAYNPVYIIRQDDMYVIKGDRMPIGFFPKETSSFTNNEFQLQKDDLIYLFTDGYIDQFGGTKGRKFMSRKFKNLLMDIHKQSLEEQKTVLTDTMDVWKGNRNEQVDDILVIGIKI